MPMADVPVRVPVFAIVPIEPTTVPNVEPVIETLVPSNDHPVPLDGTPLSRLAVPPIVPTALGAISVTIRSR